MTAKSTTQGKDRLYYLSLINKPSTIKPIPPAEQMQKRWVYALYRLSKKHKEDNATVELTYHNTLKLIKLFSGHSSLPVFERNYKNDNRENALMMHVYLSHNVYIALECEFDCNYRIHFAFNHCPYECEIRKFLTYYIYTNPINKLPYKDGFEEFYERVLTIQDKRHITY
jgi:hypothetical protein